MRPHLQRMPASFQPGFFDAGPQVLFEDAEGGVRYVPGVVPVALAERWFEEVRDTVAWSTVRRPMYDRIVDVPRLLASYRLEDPALPRPLGEIADHVRRATGEPFNAVGLNWYRDGRDSVAPHGDKLHMITPGHPIAVLSLGAPRRMVIREKQPPRRAVHVDLAPGSVLLMSHAAQLTHEHGIPKVRDPVGPRISLAFRVRPAR